ncbi:hypothetical protein [Hyalangium versicolor]|uniref:hypothetical protein n=1 Tax=Hyalangium versicolor TaxID=2861190 RepID=UPI001CCFF011|nr:hypothetical protein [Hyalangium versicolor]
MAWPKWDSLLEELDPALDGVGDITQPYMAACRRCSKSLRHVLPNGTPHVTRVVAAVSVLAPLYVTYTVTETVEPQTGSISQRISFTPAPEVELHARTLARGIERTLEYRPFPLRLSNVVVPDVFVPHAEGAQATLLSALFDSQLLNLP